MPICQYRNCRKEFEQNANFRNGTQRFCSRICMLKEYRLGENFKKKVRCSQQKIKPIILTHYGGNPPKCACCGETIVEFLSIDHINGDGANHRRKIGYGSHFYLWLIKNNFPEGFQVLCMNCNFAKGHFEICPHKKRN